MIESVFGELLSELADQTLRILVQKALEQVAERLAVKQEDGEVQVNLSKNVESEKVESEMPVIDIEKYKVVDFNDSDGLQEWLHQAKDNEVLHSSSTSSSSNSDAGFNEDNDDYWPDYGQSMADDNEDEWQNFGQSMGVDEDEVDVWEAFDELPEVSNFVVHEDEDLWEAFDELPEVSNFVVHQDEEIKEEVALPKVDIDTNPVNINTIAIPEHYFLQGSGKMPQIYLGPSTSSGQKLERFEYFFEKLNSGIYEKDEDDLDEDAEQNF